MAKLRTLVEGGGQDPDWSVNGEESTVQERCRPHAGAGQLEFEFKAALVANLIGRQPGDLISTGTSWAGSRHGPLSPIRLYAKRIVDKLKIYGAVDIIGQMARTVEEAAVLFQTFRSPQFEVVHWIFTEAGKVVGRYAVTAHKGAPTRWVTERIASP